MKSLIWFVVFGVVILSVSISTAQTTTSAPVSPLLLNNSPSLLSQMDREFTDLMNRVMPAVVSITAMPHTPQNLELFEIFGNRFPSQLGSGVIVSEDGYIVTNLHVIGGALSVHVHLSDGRKFTAQVVGSDVLTDISILKIEGANFIPLELGNSDEVQVGQMVVAVGNPYGLEETVTRGIISAKGRRGFSERVNEFFQTDVAINPGNSGGPLLDMQGKVIAINNSIFSQKGGWQGISFSIPANTVQRVFNDIRKHGHVVHTWFGVLTLSLTSSMVQQLGLSNQQGAFVYGILQNSPAHFADLRPGDIIIGFNGKNINDGIDLRNRVAETGAGQKVQLRFIRDRSEKQVDITIEKRPGT